MPIIIGFFFFCFTSIAFAVEAEDSAYVKRLPANSNDLSSVQSELDDLISISTDAAKDDTTLTLTNIASEVFVFKISSHTLDQKQIENLLHRLKSYLLLRMKGHSKPYSLYLALHSGDKWPEKVAWIGNQPDLREEIAFPWIRSDLHKSFAFPTLRESENQALIYLVDGDLAWLYLIPKANDGKEKQTYSGRRDSYRLDAIEFSPSTIESFNQIMAELKREKIAPIESEPVKPEYFGEFSNRLEKRARLKWRTPIELNLDTHRFY